MNETQKSKVERFANDELMSNAVYSILLEAYLKPSKEVSTEYLAASRIAINLLQEAWKEIGTYKQLVSKESAIKTNMGL